MHQAVRRERREALMEEHRRQNVRQGRVLHGVREQILRDDEVQGRVVREHFTHERADLFGNEGEADAISSVRA